MRGYLPLIQEDSVAGIYGLAVYERERIRSTCYIFPMKTEDSYSCFQLALLHSASYSFFHNQSPTFSLSTNFDAISPNTRHRFSQ